MEVKLLRAQSGKVIFLESGPNFVDTQTISLGLWFYAAFINDNAAIDHIILTCTVTCADYVVPYGPSKVPVCGHTRSLRKGLSKAGQMPSLITPEKINLGAHLLF